MNDLMNMLMQQMGGNAMDQLGSSLGMGKEKVSSATKSALPLLLGALAKNASNDKGRDSLFQALEKDHDGSALDNLSALLQNSSSGEGKGILKHIFGNKRDAVEDYVSQECGTDKKQASGLMEALAPMVMGALGKQRKQNNLNAGGLASILQGAVAGSSGSKEMGFLGKLLDRDGDGSYKDDVAKMGFGYFVKKLFGKK